MLGRNLYVEKNRRTKAIFAGSQRRRTGRNHSEFQSACGYTSGSCDVSCAGRADYVGSCIQPGNGGRRDFGD